MHYQCTHHLCFVSLTVSREALHAYFKQTTLSDTRSGTARESDIRQREMKVLFVCHIWKLSLKLKVRKLQVVRASWVFVRFIPAWRDWATADQKRTNHAVSKSADVLILTASDSKSICWASPELLAWRVSIRPVAEVIFAAAFARIMLLHMLGGFWIKHACALTSQLDLSDTVGPDFRPSIKASSKENLGVWCKNGLALLRWQHSGLTKRQRRLGSEVSGSLSELIQH